MTVTKASELNPQAAVDTPHQSYDSGYGFCGRYGRRCSQIILLADRTVFYRSATGATVRENIRTFDVDKRVATLKRLEVAEIGCSATGIRSSFLDRTLMK